LVKSAIYSWFSNGAEVRKSRIGLTRNGKRVRRHARPGPDGGDRVIAFVHDLIESGRITRGDRLPPERDLASAIGVSRPTVRTGLHALAAMGVVRSRHGSGTYIPDGPPALADGPLRFLAALHGFTGEQMVEARRILEVGAAGLAAERATPDDLAALADEVAGLYASLDDPDVFLVHDVSFHRRVAAASGNPIMQAVVDMVAALFYERRRETARLASEHNLRDAAAAHRRIYRAIRARDIEGARIAMNDHLLEAQRHQAQEPPAARGVRAARRPLRLSGRRRQEAR
jgi:GntR family transcriptional repressor for pyruvate dehydrogenase complex